jgi:hypothetical protein
MICAEWFDENGGRAKGLRSWPATAAWNGDFNATELVNIASTYPSCVHPALVLFVHIAW